MLGDKREDKIGRNRRDLIQPRLAEFALNVIFFREAKTAMGLEARISGFPGSLRRQHFRHVGFCPTIETRLIEPGLSRTINSAARIAV